MAISARIFDPITPRGAPSWACGRKSRGFRPSRRRSCLLDAHGVERRGGNALVHALRSPSGRHAAAGEMVRRGCPCSLGAGRARTAILARGVSAPAAARPALPRRPPFRCPAPLRDSSAPTARCHDPGVAGAARNERVAPALQTRQPRLIGLPLRQGWPRLCVT